MQLYLTEIQRWGYDNAQLEKMAYALDRHYSQKGESKDVDKVVNYALEQGNA
jgi:hypothetical protein